jgi:hypothetical protein
MFSGYIPDEILDNWEHVTLSMCCFTSETRCQPYVEEESPEPEACEPGQLARKRRAMNRSESIITQLVKAICKSVRPEDNSYAELFNQTAPKVGKLSSHDIMVICLTRCMITVALVVGVAWACVAHKRASRAAEYRAFQDLPSPASQ